MSKIYAKVGQDAKGRWLIVVARDRNGKTEVLTVGVETSQEAAFAWGDAAIKARGWLPGREDPPDASDRETRH